jgi:hypothetical protein
MFQSGSHDASKGNHRMLNIVQGISDHNMRLWTARNDMLHNKTEGDLARIRSAEVAEIISLHEQPERLRFDDRYLCNRPLEKLLSSAPSTRRRWLRRVKSSRELHDSDRARQSQITTFLGRRLRTPRLGHCTVYLKQYKYIAAPPLGTGTRC